MTVIKLISNRKQIKDLAEILREYKNVVTAKNLIADIEKKLFSEKIGFYYSLEKSSKREYYIFRTLGYYLKH